MQKTKDTLGCFEVLGQALITVHSVGGTKLNLVMFLGFQAL